MLEQGELDANPDEQLLLKLQEIVSGRIPSPKERPAKVSTPPPEKKLSNVAPSHSPKKHKTTKGETIRIPYSRLQELMHSSEELNSVKIKYLAPGKDGGNDLMLLSSGQDKYGMGRRLFKCFQKCIKSLRGEHVNLMNNVYTV